MADKELESLLSVLTSSIRNRNNTGNARLTQDTKLLFGFLDQPTSINIAKYDAAKSYFLANGASDQAASGLAILMANIAVRTGKDVTEVIAVGNALGLNFNDSVFEQLNKIRRPESQYFYSKGAKPSNTLSRNVPKYVPIKIDSCGPLVISGNCPDMPNPDAAYDFTLTHNLNGCGPYTWSINPPVP